MALGHEGKQDEMRLFFMDDGHIANWRGLVVLEMCLGGVEGLKS